MAHISHSCSGKVGSSERPRTETTHHISAYNDGDASEKLALWSLGP